MRRLLVGSTLLLALGAGCEVTTPPAPSRIGGAQHITFRCAPREASVLDDTGYPALRGVGAPLDACGCTQYTDDGRLGLLHPTVCSTGNAEVRAYVAGNAVGEVAAVRLNRGAGTGEARILDADPTVPGVTGIYVDDLVSDLEAEPQGRFVMAVNATSGTLAFIVDDFALRPELVLDPGLGPLAQAAIWPPAERALGRDEAGGVPTIVLPEGGRAWITAPADRRVIEIDLEQVWALLDGGEIDPESVVRRIYDMPGDAVPDAIAVHPDGDRIYVGHAAEPAITQFDVATGEPTGRIDMSRQSDCGDSYLTNIVARDDDQSCLDGLDNDGDGVVDGADPDCDGPFGSEWPDPACPQIAECADGADNDGDGLVDAEDEDCAGGTGRWEGAPPACANGLDDDEDGTIDREDLGCVTEGDRDELPVGNGLETAEAGLCTDREDNDGDGLVDGEDPGCNELGSTAALRYAEERVAACADGIDNDGDGRTDFAGMDGDCYAASDDTEGGSRIELGPSEIVTVDFVINGRRFDYLFTTEAVGYVVSVDLADPGLRARYTGLDRTALNLALRRGDDSNTLFAMVSDNSLRAMLITMPAQLRTADRRDVYARFSESFASLDDLSRADPDEDYRLLYRHTGIGVQAFYAVEDGVAGRITAMDDICPVQLTADDGTCPEGRSPAIGACVPTPCADDGECPGGFACLDSACVRMCAADFDCSAHELCEGVSPDVGAAQTVCRSRCRLDDRAVVHVAPPRDPCAEGNCGEACEGPADCSADLACVDGACSNWCTASSCDAPFDPATAPLVEPAAFARLGGDRLVMRADRSWIVNDEVNVLRASRARTPRVTATPRILVGGTAAAVDLGVLPSFCQIPQPSETAAFEGWPAGDCVPPGRAVDPDSGVLVNLSAEQQAQLFRHRVDFYPYIQVVEDRSGQVPSQEFALAWEGVLPGSESRTGQNVGPTPITVGADVSSTGGETTVEGWTLVDYDQNFCSVGVEVDDMVIIDRMEPRDPGPDLSQEALDELCRPFLDVDTSLPPDQRREPLRYRVVEVGPFKLVLRPDGTHITDTPGYDAMLQRGDRHPDLAEPRPAPPAACMAGLTTYRVRSTEEFLLTGRTSRYRHPWVRRGASCVEDPQRLERRGRVQFGVPFENEWFRFQVGPAVPELLGGRTLPYLVDVEFRFNVDSGEFRRQLSEFSLMPQGMKWQPTSDLLYVVDGAIQTLVEITNLDVLRSEPAVSNFSYD